MSERFTESARYFPALGSLASKLLVLVILYNSRIRTEGTFHQWVQPCLIQIIFKLERRLQLLLLCQQRTERKKMHGSVRLQWHVFVSLCFNVPFSVHSVVAHAWDPQRRVWPRKFVPQNPRRTMYTQLSCTWEQCACIQVPLLHLASNNSGRKCGLPHTELYDWQARRQSNIH